MLLQFRCSSNIAIVCMYACTIHIQCMACDKYILYRALWFFLQEDCYVYPSILGPCCQFKTSGKKVVSKSVLYKGWSYMIMSHVRNVLCMDCKRCTCMAYISFDCIKGPNDVWHVDGNDKLVPYGFHIHGCIDGWVIQEIHAHHFNLSDKFCACMHVNGYHATIIWLLYSFSRRIMWLKVGVTNKDPKVIASFYLAAVQSVGGIII